MLGQQIGHDLGSVGWPDQSLLQALAHESELIGIEPQRMQERGLEILDVDAVFDDFVAKFIGGTVNVTSFESAAGHPDAETVRMVIAPQELASVACLDHWCAAKLTAEHDERFVQHAPLFEVGQ